MIENRKDQKRVSDRESVEKKQEHDIVKARKREREKVEREKSNKQTFEAFRT